VANSVPRLLASALLLLLTLAVAGGARLSSGPAQPAVAQAAETFTQQAPLKVYSDVQTHTGIADADPTAGTNGYCVAVQFTGHTAAGPANGFSILNGTIVTTSFFNNGSATTDDDVYCVVARATRITTMPRPAMVVSWTYTDGAITETATLNIQVVTVVLKGTDGVVGGVASVCTEGWDPTFLTGKTENTPPEIPQNLDRVVVADWTTTPDGGPSNVSKIGVYRTGPLGQEWCVNITASAPVAGITVRLDFYALYDTAIIADDVLLFESGTAIVSIKNAVHPELRHITPFSAGGQTGGQIFAGQQSPAAAIGSTHTACVLPSVNEDTLAPADINIASNNGANVSGLAVFHKAPGGDPVGVPDETLCFSWTSTSPGLQTVTARVLLSDQNPTNIGLPPRFDNITWSSNATDATLRSRALLVPWNTLDRTVLTTGGPPSPETDITNGVISARMRYDIGLGTFRLGSGIGITEWVLGHRPGPLAAKDDPTDGVPLEIKIVSGCGYLVTDAGPVTILSGPDVFTSNGRYSFKVDIAGDTGCTQGSQIRIEVRARYPASIAGGTVLELETLTINLLFEPPENAPVFAWVGDTVSVTFPYVINTDIASCDEFVVVYQRSKGQPGTFIGPGASADFARAVPTPRERGCDITMQYESQDPGEVDIVIQIEGLPFTKSLQTIFFMVFEDVRLTLEPEHTVSEAAQLDGLVRGWFPGTNKSGRPAEVKQGVALPKDRWVLPDDYLILKGPEDFRPAWPIRFLMPWARVTWVVENEAKTNSYKNGVADGTAGFFRIDDFCDYDPDIHPDTGIKSVNGLPERPRIVSTLLCVDEDTGIDGLVTIDVIGDSNLSYEGCDVNASTGSPLCKVGDIVGKGRYHAVADYLSLTPEDRVTIDGVRRRARAGIDRGKWLPVTSNTVETTFTWNGYKELSWEDTADPQIKYVVAHMKDRDGFCDAIGFHNNNGIIVDFQIDAGGGVIAEAKDRPSTITGNSKLFGTSTSYDTVNGDLKPINAELVRTVVKDDECQAWIKITNSLLKPTDVVVTFPPAPSSPPGDIRITELVCGGGGYVVLKNFGTNLVSLAGYGLRSYFPDYHIDRGSVDLDERTRDFEEHLGLQGHLAPGESVKILGEYPIFPWQFFDEQAPARIFGNTPFDYVDLIWEEQSLGYGLCDDPEDRKLPRTIVQLPPPVLPADGEGAIRLSITVPFGAETQTLLQAGWNLVAVPEGDNAITIKRAAAAGQGKLVGIYQWDAIAGIWRRYIAGAPQFLNSIDKLEPGKVYWVQAKEAFTLSIPK
jgi:hypothetical protein